MRRAQRHVFSGFVKGRWRLQSVCPWTGRSLILAVERNGYAAYAAATFSRDFFRSPMNIRTKGDAMKTVL